MYSFVVLGLIPGTNFQISFVTWIDVILLAVAVLALRDLYFRVRQVPLVVSTRQEPLHARQLHRRG